MRLLVVALLAFSLEMAQAQAYTGTITTKVNFREGPGTNFQSMGTLDAGTSVEITECDESGSWCAVSISGQSGFVSGEYISVSEEEGGWPRTFQAEDGAVIVLYQPQITEWANFTTLKAMVATEYRPAANEAPVFGVINLEGKTFANEDSDEVFLQGIKVTGLVFSVLSKDQLSKLNLEVGKLIPVDTITLSKQRIAASLANSQQMQNVEGLQAEAPPIFHSTQDAVLLQTDGEPIEAPVQGVDELLFIVNTNWDLFKLNETGTYYLRDEEAWLSSDKLDGTWIDAGQLPEVFSKLPDDESWQNAKAAFPNKGLEGAAVPVVFYSDRPAELLLFEGEPTLEDVGTTELQWASNSTSDVFFHKTEKNWYTLLSGRWFRAQSLDGPWTFATPDLPQDFQFIPEDAPYYSVRASIPGTSESAEARLLASIPTTARVEVGSIQPEVSYAGNPDFQPIDGTSLSYAVNTSSQVLQVGTAYYVVQDGVWFTGPSANGPWEVATSVPDEIYEIPPSSPVYNTTYVRVYESEPASDTSAGAVWFGFTMGYLWSYLAWDTYVYGNGYWYPPYYRPWRPGYYPPYFPRPVTFGSGIYYNPARGVFGRYGYAYGPNRGIAVGRVYNPSTGRYIRGGYASGPRGAAGFISVTNPITGNKAFVGGGRNIYGSWNTGGVKLGSEWARANPADRLRDGAGPGRWNRASKEGLVERGRRGEIFAGQDGKVYRNMEGKWQQFDRGNWEGIDGPAAERLDRDRLETVAAGAAGAAIGAGAVQGLKGTGAGQTVRDRAAASGAGQTVRDRAAASGAGQTVRDRAAGSGAGQTIKDRAQQRPDGVQRPAARPDQPRAERPAARPQTREAVKQRKPAAVQRPAARKAPTHLRKDQRARQVGNKRVHKSREARKPATRQARPQARKASHRSRGGGGKRRR
ncbi:SH3 domain-containing protein [Pseudovibrio sp. SPO723]|uniref:SH3 domain-containing protein n=1 Tax=Nesiotobacter zosterae TaxID=392721 RepID=UPI0029C13B0C|nr:SH3 domain-containing protein [Pseudovibrio sp. SPO723]MDX5593165.1 SH3 domain-containing protein [Pseudovibrio sp. SPO723]